MATLTGKAEQAFLIRVITAAPLFERVDSVDIAEIARCGRMVAVARGKPVAAPKGKAEEIYIIEKGAAALLDRDPATGRAVLIALFGAGETIGLVRAAEIMGGTAPAHQSEWRALSNLTGVAIPIADFIRVMRRSPDLANAAHLSLAHSIRQVTASFSSSLRHPLEMRLASFLEYLGGLVAPARWSPTVNLGKLQQTQIAEMLSVSREHVNRTLIMWEKSGLIFQTKRGDIVIENRKRLSQIAGTRRAEGVQTAETDRLWEIEAHINLGLYAAAYDLAMEGARRSPKDNRFKYFATLALARMGSLTDALALARSFKLTTEDDNEDAASIVPRLQRDLAFAAGPTPDLKMLEEAAQGFEKVFRSVKTIYPGVNAAASWAMSGDKARAGKLAAEVAAAAASELSDIDADEPSYWRRATLAECRLIEGDVNSAAAGFGEAANSIDAAPGKIATTRKQLRRLQSATHIDGAWIDDALPQGRVLYFCGPIATMTPASQHALEKLGERFAALLEKNEIVAAIGALAAGADIALAEAVIAAGIPFHAMLPLPPEQFLDVSVLPFGEEWRERYVSCVERAQSIEWMRRAAPCTAAYRLGAHIAIGRTIRLADDLAAQPLGFFATQKGRTASNSISIENLELWKKLGLAAAVAEDEWPALAPASLAGQDKSEFFAALIVDGKPAPTVARLLTDKSAGVADAGLSIYAYRSATDALDAARALISSKNGEKMRIWLDAGVCPKGTQACDKFVDSLITAASRPQTPAGKAYASENFFSLALAAAGEKPRFDYAGYAPTDEKIDPCPLFLTDI